MDDAGGGGAVAYRSRKRGRQLLAFRALVVPAKAGTRGYHSPLAPGFPLSRRAVRGKLGISKLQLVGGAGAGLGGVDIGRALDVGDRLACEEAGRDEVGETDCRQGNAAIAGGDAQQEIGDHGGDDLEADGVWRAAEELAQLEMLLDPAEQELDLPAHLVERGDLDGRSVEII